MFHYELSAADMRRLRRHPALPAAPGARAVRSVEYFDTPDALLAARGLTLMRVRTGWQWRLELCSPTGLEPDTASGLGWPARSIWSVPCQPSRLELDGIAERRWRDWLAGLDLCAQGTETIRAECLAVDTAAGPVEVWLERVEQRHASGSRTLARLHVLPGQDVAPAALLCRALLGAFALYPLLVPPVQQLRGAQTPLAASRARPSLPAGRAGGPAFVHIARNCVSHLCLNLPGLASCDAPEFVHQARVAIRRLRSALKLFAPWLPSAFVTEFGERWRDIANALGDCRNLDVFIAETLPLLERELRQPDWAVRLRRAAGRRQRQARRAARAALASPAFRLLLFDFELALAQLEFPAHMPPLRKLARRRLMRRAAQVVRLGEAVRDLDPEARHELRIAFKKLRYALEFFAGLFGEKRSKRYLAGLVDLQAVLGHLNDLATAQLLVGALLPEAQARLVQAWLAGRSGALVDALPAAIAHFLAAQPPWE
ncbi:MAG: CHAD domain-containing protein [Azovibrio sp.]|nr:CHAD domain-containing protein [Azovibrio sp.]